jgi:hypothetical protein
MYRVEHPEGPDNDVTTEHHITKEMGRGHIDRSDRVWGNLHWNRCFIFKRLLHYFR